MNDWGCRVLQDAADVREALRSVAVGHLQKLKELLGRAEENDKPAIRLLIQKIAEGYQAAIGE